MPKKETVITGALILTIAGLISKVLGFLYRIFLSNLIGAEGMGIFQLIFPVITFCTALCCGGIQTAVSRFVAESNDKRKSFSILIASIAMSTFLSLVTALTLYCFAMPASHFILQNDSCYSLLKYSSYVIPFAAFHACITGYYLGLKKTFVPAASQILEQLLKVVSLFVLGIVYVGNNLEITPALAIFSLLISEIGGSLFCFIAIYNTKLKLGFSNRLTIPHLFADIKKLFSVSYILTLNRIMLTFLQSVEALIVPIVLLKYGLSNSDALSVYGILSGMALPVVTFPAAINVSVAMMIMPTIAEANVDGKQSRVKATTEFSTWFSIVIGIFCIGIFIFYGDFIGGTIFGHPEAGKYIKTLAWLCPFMYLSITLGSILHGLGRTTAAFVHNVIASIIRVLFLWFVVPIIGISGYFLGLMVSYFITTMLHFIYIAKDVPYEFSPVLNIIKPTIWLLISLTVGKLTLSLLDFLQSIPYGNIFAKCLSGVSICAVFSYFVFKQWKTVSKNL